MGDKLKISNTTLEDNYGNFSPVGTGSISCADTKQIVTAHEISRTDVDLIDATYRHLRTSPHGRQADTPIGAEFDLGEFPSPLQTACNHYRNKHGQNR